MSDTLTPAIEIDASTLNGWTRDKITERTPDYTFDTNEAKRIFDRFFASADIDEGSTDPMCKPRSEHIISNVAPWAENGNVVRATCHESKFSDGDHRGLDWEHTRFYTTGDVLVAEVAHHL